MSEPRDHDGNIRKIRMASGAQLLSYPFDPLDENYPIGMGDQADCPVCGEMYSHKSNKRNVEYEGYSPLHPGYILYRCGGGWLETVDHDGNQIWAGRCGKPLVQMTLNLEAV